MTRQCSWGLAKQTKTDISNPGLCAGGVSIGIYFPGLCSSGLIMYAYVFRRCAQQGSLYACCYVSLDYVPVARGICCMLPSVDFLCPSRCFIGVASVGFTPSSWTPCCCGVLRIAVCLMKRIMHDHTMVVGFTGAPSKHHCVQHALSMHLRPYCVALAVVQCD